MSQEGQWVPMHQQNPPKKNFARIWAWFKKFCLNHFRASCVSPPRKCKARPLSKCFSTYGPSAWNKEQDPHRDDTVTLVWRQDQRAACWIRALRLIQVFCQSESWRETTVQLLSGEREPNNQRLTDLRLRMEEALSTIDEPVNHE